MSRGRRRVASSSVPSNIPFGALMLLGTAFASHTSHYSGFRTPHGSGRHSGPESRSASSRSFRGAHVEPPRHVSSVSEIAAAVAKQLSQEEDSVSPLVRCALSSSFCLELVELFTTLIDKIFCAYLLEFSFVAIFFISLWS
jgi:hypothetical protein